jgi:hypothetical protein
MMHSWIGVTVGKKRSPLNRSEVGNLNQLYSKRFSIFPTNPVRRPSKICSNKPGNFSRDNLPSLGIRLALAIAGCAASESCWCQDVDCPPRTIGPISANLRQPTAATVYKRGFFGRWHNVMRADSEIRLKELCPKLLSAKSEEADRVKAELRVILAEYTREKAAAAKLN